MAVVTAKMKKKGHGKAGKHAHPVRRMTITPTDNGGFSTETEMHPPMQKGENSMYQPGETVTGAHASFPALQKHVKDMLKLKTDAEEQGPGEEPGGDPGDDEDAE
ncbi:MAG: hypothetical protein ACLGXA_08045 [Acidobacteriota bacterium]